MVSFPFSRRNSRRRRCGRSLRTLSHLRPINRFNALRSHDFLLASRCLGLAALRQHLHGIDHVLGHGRESGRARTHGRRQHRRGNAICGGRRRSVGRDAAAAAAPGSRSATAPTAAAKHRCATLQNAGAAATRRLAVGHGPVPLNTCWEHKEDGNIVSDWFGFLSSGPALRDHLYMWKTANNTPAPDNIKTNNNKKNLYKITINYKLGTMAKTKLLYAIDAAT